MLRLASGKGISTGAYGGGRSLCGLNTKARRWPGCFCLTISRIPNGHYKVGKLFLADISNAAKGMRNLKGREGLDKVFLLGFLKINFVRG
jgi:hypothetical protein